MAIGGRSLALVTQQGQQGCRHSLGQGLAKSARAGGQLLQQPGGTSPIPLAQYLAGQVGIGIGLLAPPAQQAQLGRRIQALRQDGPKIMVCPQNPSLQSRQPGFGIQLGLAAQLLQPGPAIRAATGWQIRRH